MTPRVVATLNTMVTRRSLMAVSPREQVKGGFSAVSQFAIVLTRAIADLHIYRAAVERSLHPSASTVHPLYRLHEEIEVQQWPAKPRIPSLATSTSGNAQARAAR